MTKLREPDHQHAAPAREGIHRLPGRVKETHFAQETYQGAGYRWGMGIDGSEKRLCEYRCLGLFDEMTNWYVDRPMPLKHMQAISESRSDIGERGKPPVRRDVRERTGQLPEDRSAADGRRHEPDHQRDEARRLLRHVGRGAHLQLRGRGHRRPADDQSPTSSGRFRSTSSRWYGATGTKTDRQIISTTDLPAFGKKHFQIPFNAAGKKWVRFAAWDVATNGAFVQPIRLTRATTTVASR